MTPIIIKNATLYNCDCMELMKQYPDNHFDLAIVDPPYGINRDGQTETFTKNPKHKRKHFENKGWDANIPTKEYFYELNRVSKNQIIWGANYFVEHLTSSMGWIFWDKGQDLSMSDGELAYSSFERALIALYSLLFFLMHVQMMNRGQLMVEGGTIHPTQKPIKLYEWLLTNYAKQGDKILDTHLGSGSHAIACNNLGFELIACELDEDYFKASIERIKREAQQERLF